MQPLIEGVDFYIEEGLVVLTAKYLSERGYCCGSGCRHCPYKIITSSDGDKEKSKEETTTDKQAENG
jgi:hypothetical protein